MDNPRISVCIPTYNFARFLPDAIESVLHQTWQDYELLIIDNASTDETREVVGRYAGKDRRIRLIINRENIGQINNWNKCLAEARGIYIKYLFADDVLTSPVALARMVGVLEADSRVSLVASARRIVDAELQERKTCAMYRSDRSVEGPKVIARSLWEHKNLIGEASAVMFRRTQAVRGFSSDYIALNDLEMWFHLLEQGALHFIAEPLCSIRLHPQQATHDVTMRPEVLLDTKYLLAEYLGKGYNRFGGIARRIIEYDRRYNVWKAYRRGRISREQFIDHLGGGLAGFYGLLPLYKLYRPVQKIRDRLVYR